MLVTNPLKPALKRALLITSQLTSAFFPSSSAVTVTNRSRAWALPGGDLLGFGDLGVDRPVVTLTTFERVVVDHQVATMGEVKAVQFTDPGGHIFNISAGGTSLLGRGSEART